MGSSGKIDLRAALGNVLLAKQDGKVVNGSTSALDGKYVGLLFSAHWCPPCRAFTPIMRKLYLSLVAQNKPFEMVFMSKDNNAADFEKYYEEMPWMAVPYAQQEITQALGRRFGVMGIPTLVIVDPEGMVINSNARGTIMRDLEGQRFPWVGEEESSARPQLNWVHWVLFAFVIWYLVFKQSDA